MAEPHLILVGLPGAGKSTVGEGAAKALRRPFLDFDVEITRRAGLSVAKIFRDKGESVFRALELELTKELAQRSGMVLSPGGGWIAVPGALELVRPPARLIYLKTDPAVALKRMGKSTTDRPLLKTADPLAELVKLHTARERFYAQADHVIDVDLIDLKGVILEVVRLASL